MFISKRFSIFASIIHLIGAFMLIFGYIISETKYKDLVEDIVKVVKNIDDCSLNLPKLIVGLSNAKEYANKHNFEFDILDNKFPDGNMWTFKKTEKRDSYEDTISYFKQQIIKKTSKNCHYYYINIYKLKYNDIKRLYNLLLNNDNKILIDNNMLYISIKNNETMGLSFSHLKYVNIDKEKVINLLKKNNHNEIHFTTSRNMWQLKKWFNGIEYVIPSILANNRLN